MNRPKGPVAVAFEELVSAGHLSPVEFMENLRLPGEFSAVPSIISYNTPEIPIRNGIVYNAKLGQCAEGNLTFTSEPT